MAFEYAGYVWRKGADPEFWKKFIRHPVETTKAARKQPEVRKQMLKYAKAHPECEATGLTPIQVHHVRPAANYPELAADYENFISLCPDMHMKLMGHPLGTKSYNPQVKGDAVRMREFITEMENRCIKTKSYKWFEKQKDGNAL